VKSFKELTSTNEKYDAYYAMVDAKAMAKKKGGKPEDYIDDMMKKRGYKKSNYSGHGVWKWVKEDVSEGTMQQGIFDKDLKKRKDAARKLVFFLRTKKNLKIGPKDEKQGDSNKEIDA